MITSSTSYPGNQDENVANNNNDDVRVGHHGMTMMMTIPPPLLTATVKEKPFEDMLISFLLCCLQKEPSKRSTASELLEHPFICEVKKTRPDPLDQNSPTLGNTGGGEQKGGVYLIPPISTTFLLSSSSPTVLSPEQ
eukprot:TRINITY_DN59889_c0_g1_i1.p1 TRINITY_DN59889_c0_g1~~TRINITY_DN59889_c0_g1_i1.p1  ORF type:complete len:137 (-),score=27.97 TRINITY_DN59889_c0_g1_i1:9-419(-)